jgi:hypothetical protein
MDEKAVADQLERVRRICLAQPGVSERLSHGEPTWFAGKRVFVMFANNHHGDGHIAVWLPVPEGTQVELVAQSPSIYFRPPYVGTKAWVGIELARIGERRLAAHIVMAWELVAPPKLASATPKPRGRSSTR